MSAAFDLSGARPGIVLDLRDPFSYLALAPAIEFAVDEGIRADWLPIRAHTLVAPSEPSASDDRGIRHRRFRAHMIAREIAIYAEAQGIEIRSPYRDGSAEAAYAAWLWVRETNPDRLPAFLTEIFRGYWSQGLDPESQSAVTRVLAALDLDPDACTQWCERDAGQATRDLAQQLREAGLSHAPAYLVEDEVFYGRQHLPMIRWILNGRSGDGPI